MAQSLSKIYIHLIFHIKTTSPAIRQEDIERVHCYVGQLVNTTGCKTVKVGGVNDHMHILFLLSRDVAISHVVEEIKIILFRENFSKGSELFVYFLSQKELRVKREESHFYAKQY